MAAIVGCSDDDSTSLGNNGRKNTKEDTSDPTKMGTGTSGGTNPDTNTVSAAVTACTAVAAPTQLSDAKDVTDVTIAGNAVFFQSGTSINRVFKLATNKKEIFKSPNLVHFYADKTGLLIIEQTDTGNPNARLRAFNANATDAEQNPSTTDTPEFPIQDGDNPGGATSDTNFNSASVHIFGADDDNYYIQYEDPDNGNQVLSQVNRNNPGQRNKLVDSAKVVTNPQLASSAVWWVEDNQRIKKIAIATGDQPQGQVTEVFGTQQNCNLAVSEQNLFCTTSSGSSIESRTLTGGDVKTVMGIAASKIGAAPFGDAQYVGGGTLIVRNLSPDTVDAPVKNVIRSISTPGGEEKLLACGRDVVGTITADNTNVVWAEKTSGVYITTR